MTQLVKVTSMVVEIFNGGMVDIARRIIVISVKSGGCTNYLLVLLVGMFPISEKVGTRL